MVVWVVLNSGTLAVSKKRYEEACASENANLTPRKVFKQLCGLFNQTSLRLLKLGEGCETHTICRAGFDFTSLQMAYHRPRKSDSRDHWKGIRQIQPYVIGRNSILCFEYRDALTYLKMS